MRKFIIITILLLAFLGAAFLFLRISKDTVHKTIIPDDANAVAVFDAKILLKEAEVSVFSIDADGEGYGIDFSYPVYAFLTQGGNVGFAAMISDEDALEENFLETRRREGLTWGIFAGGLACHDGDRVLLIGPSATWDDKKVQDEMLALMRKESLSSAIYDRLNHETAGLKARMSMKALPQSVADDIRSRIVGYGMDISEVDLSSIYLNIGLHATENTQTLSLSADSPDESVAGIIETYKNSIKPINRVATAYIPEDHVMWMCMNLEGYQILERLKSDRQMNAYIGLINTFVDVDGFANAISGDVMLVLGNIDMQKPQVGMVAQINDNRFLNSNFKNVLKSLNLQSGEFSGDTDRMIYVATSETLVERMSASGNVANKVFMDLDESVFCLSMNAGKTLELVTALSPSGKYGEYIDRYGKDVERVDLNLTKEVLELKVTFKDTLNKLVRKWTE